MEHTMNATRPADFLRLLTWTAEQVAAGLTDADIRAALPVRYSLPNADRDVLDIYIREARRG